MSDTICQTMTGNLKKSTNYHLGPVTVIKKLSASLANLVETAKDAARKSVMPMRHGAVLFAHSGKQIYSVSENTHGNKVCGHDVPGCHAEANCLQPVYYRRAAAQRRRYQTGIGRAKVYREKERRVLWGGEV